RREDRFKPILLKFPELARRVSAEELALLFPRIEMVEPGSPVVRRFRDTKRSEEAFTFQAFLAIFNRQVLTFALLPDKRSLVLKIVTSQTPIQSTAPAEGVCKATYSCLECSTLAPACRESSVQIGGPQPPAGG